MSCPFNPSDDRLSMSIAAYGTHVAPADQAADDLPGLPFRITDVISGLIDPQRGGCDRDARLAAARPQDGDVGFRVRLYFLYLCGASLVDP